MAYCEFPPCRVDLPIEATARRRYCTPAHRTADLRRREREAASAVEDLLRRQSEALASGADPVVVAALQREAARLLGRRA